MTTILSMAGEDLDFRTDTGAWAAGTTGGTFRSTYARCSMAVLTPAWVEPAVPFSASTFWMTHWTYTASGGNSANQAWITFVDVNRVVRLALRGTGTSGQYQLKKVNAVGTETNLGSPLTLSFSLNALNKIDCFVSYSASGTFRLYLNGAQQGSTVTGDFTTDGVTSLSNYQLTGNTNGSFNFVSEIIVSDTDTRSMSLQTLAPVANGNTHNFDTGSPAATNVNEIIINDATLDGSTTAGQIDQYTIPAIAAGTFTIMAVGVSARMQKGATGPTKMDLNVRSGGADYFSADQVLGTSWATGSNIWNADPATSATWTALPANIGLKSVA